MSRKGRSDLTSLVVVGVIMFAIGRCTDIVPDVEQNSTSSPVEALETTTENEIGTSADSAIAAAAAAVNAAAEATVPAAEAQATISKPARLLSRDVDLEELAEERDAPRCGSKRLCRQMNSCQEAYHYLNECGVGRLDRDGDGVPCESIC
jgi:hypothetical protein